MNIYIGSDMTVDEQFSGRCAIRQHIPNKPAKYGLKIWYNCDGDTFYSSKGEIYLGRKPDESRHEHYWTLA